MELFDILAVANSVNTNLTEMRGRFFNVIKEPLFVGNPLLVQPKDMFAVYRTDTNKLINPKSTGKDFLPMQQEEFLTNIVATVHDNNADLDLSKLTFTEFNGGSNIEFKIELDPMEFINKAEILDKTRMFLSFSTSYDGSKSNLISLFTEREICTNGLTVKDVKAMLKGRNTLGGKAKILSYALEVGRVLKGVQDFKLRCEALNKIEVSKETIEAMKKQIFGTNLAELVASDKKNTAKIENILSAFDESVELEFSRTGATAFGLLQGVTHYTNHVANRSKTITDEEFIRFHSGAKMNDKAQDFLFKMIKFVPSQNEYVMA